VSRFVLVCSVFPDLKIDAITLGLLIVAVLPWLTSLIESAKFPGGWEIKFRDLKEAAEQVTSDTEALEIDSAEEITDRVQAYQPQQDSNLALVGLRIEIERRVRAAYSRPSLPLIPRQSCPDLECLATELLPHLQIQLIVLRFSKAGCTVIASLIDMVGIPGGVGTGSSRHIATPFALPFL